MTVPVVRSETAGGVCTVTLDDPVDLPFVRLIMLRAPSSIEYTAVELPNRDPDVTDTRRLPRTPCDSRHRRELSDSHSLDSQPVASNPT